MTGILNLPGLNELGMKELDAEYHVKAEPAAISRLCPHCGELHRVQKHGSRSMFIRELPSVFRLPTGGFHATRFS